MNNSEGEPAPRERVAEWSLESESLPGGRLLVTDPLVIGRGSDCDLVIEDPHLSRRHAEIRVAGQYLEVEDLGSANGTYLNGERISEGEARPGDEIRLDQLAFRVCGPISADMEATQLRDPDATALHPGAALQGDVEPAPDSTRVFGTPSAWLLTSDGERFKLETGVTRIGRATDSDLVLDDPSVSSRHAELAEQQGEWILTDLGSTNGTCVDDRAVERARLTDGARLRFGQVNLQFVREAPAGILKAPVTAAPRRGAGQRWLWFGLLVVLVAGVALAWVLQGKFGA